MLLTTPRLFLRPFKEGDFTALRELAAYPVIFRFRSRSTITEDETREFLARCQESAFETPPSMYAFALVMRDTSRLIGECGLNRLKEAPTEAYLWFSLHPVFWQQGYMREAASAVLDFGFREALLERIHASCHPDNLASRHVLERIGMHPLQKTGTIEPSPRIHFGLSSTEWSSGPR